jgi:TfoX/Sxy family transcriptional regulator of competence genes
MTAEDDPLLRKVRAALSGAGAIHEVKMFGGVGFMLDGNMLAGVSKRGLLLRVGKDRYQEALARPGTRPMEMRGRAMEGYVYVDPQGLTEAEIRARLLEASAFVRTLPRKSADVKPARKGKLG